VPPLHATVVIVRYVGSAVIIYIHRDEAIN